MAKVFVFSNLATSLDGKIATRSRVHFALGTNADRKQMLVLRKRADAVIVGASTLRAYRAPLLARAQGAQPINVVVSSRLEGFSTKWAFFTDRRTRKILFVGHDTPENRILKFSAVAVVCQLAPPTAHRSVAQQIVSFLQVIGVRRLLVEGGGGLMWDFLRPGLLDELHITLTPRILGGTEAPTLVDGPGFSPSEVMNFKIKSCRKLGNELYLVYSKTKKRGP